MLLPLSATAGTVVSGERLVAVALQQLQESAESVDARWEFIPTAAVSDSMLVQEGTLELTAGTIDGRWPRSRVGVPVQIAVDRAAVQTRMLWFTVHAWRDAHVYERDQQAGDASDGIQTEVRPVDLAAQDVSSVLPAQGALAAGLRLRRTVRAGQPVLGSDFLPMPAVARNAQVNLRVQHGEIALNTRAMVRTDAAEGERVDVLPSGATQWISATVTGRNEVAIED